MTSPSSTPPPPLSSAEGATEQLASLALEAPKVGEEIEVEGREREGAGGGVSGDGRGERRGSGAAAGEDMPLTMAQSVILTSLPRDTTEALEEAGRLGVEKVTIRFHAIGSAPLLRQKQFKLSASQRFETVVRFLKKRLGGKEGESVFCYINSVFSPGLDEGVGNLWRCFKVNDELVVHYSLNAAFG